MKNLYYLLFMLFSVNAFGQADQYPQNSKAFTIIDNKQKPTKFLEEGSFTKDSEIAISGIGFDLFSKERNIKNSQIYKLKSETEPIEFEFSDTLEMDVEQGDSVKISMYFFTNNYIDGIAGVFSDDLGEHFYLSGDYYWWRGLLTGGGKTYAWYELGITIHTQPDTETGLYDLTLDLMPFDENGLLGGLLLKRICLITVTAVQPPTADFTADTTSGDKDLPVKFTENSTGSITSRSWDFGDGGTSTEQNPSHTYTEAGVYTVSLTVTGPGGSDTETKSDYITVTVPPAPVAGFSTNVTNGDEDLLVTFADSSSGNITSWLWNFGDGTTSAEQNPSHTYTDAGTYTVTLTVTGAGGSDTEMKENYITVVPPTSAADLAKEGEIIYYPNPVKTVCTIKIPENNTGNVGIKIYNNDGVEVYSKTGIKEKFCEIDLSALSAGLYIITVTSENNRLTDKLTIAE